MADSVSTTISENATKVANVVIAETTTLLNNLTTTTGGIMFANTTDAGSSAINEFHNATGILQESLGEDGIHKNPELKYFSTVIIIFMGLTILIVPVFCFVGFVCARARIFKTVREAAGKGWGFEDLSVPYTEFGSEDYSKEKPGDSSSKNCDVQVLVTDDNCVPSSSSVIVDISNPRRTKRRGSFLGSSRPQFDEDEEDLSSLPATFVHSNPA